MFDPVPWAIGGGAEIPTEALRLIAFVSSGAAEGVVSPGDLKVSATAVPSGKVRWAPGAAMVPNRSAGGAQQSYAVRNPTGTTEVLSDIAPTGSGGGRSDLLVVRVEDPQYSPWQAYTDPAKIEDGPYVFPRVISGVPAGTRLASDLGLPHSMYALARVDVPANTGTITQAMITDLRQLVSPRKDDDLSSSALPANGGAIDTTSWKTWPEGQAKAIYIPPWATHISTISHYSGVVRDGGSVGAELRGRIGDFHTAGAVTVEFDAGTSGYDEAAREGFFHVAGSFIPANRRGTTVEVATEARRVLPNVYSGVLRSVDSAQVAYDIRFYERVL